MSVLPAHICRCTMCMLGAYKHYWVLVTEVADSCELPHRCWESNSGPLEEQLVLVTPESSLQPLLRSFEMVLRFLVLQSTLINTFIHTPRMQRNTVLCGTVPRN